MNTYRKIAICDDDKNIQQLLKSACQYYYSDKDYKIHMDIFSTGEELLNSVHKYDYILLDIEMYDLNGIEVAEKIRETDIDTMIVIISGYPKYKNRAYSVHVFDYIDKPISKVRFFNLLDELERYSCKKIEKSYLSFKTIHGVVQLDKDDIVYLEYFDRKINIHTIEKEYSLYGKISDLASQLSEFMFLFPHRSYIVNMQYINKIEGNSIFLANSNITIPISKLKKKEISDTFFKYLAAKAENNFM